MSSQREIDELKKKLYKGYLLQEKIIDTVTGIFLFVIIFGIGFTFGYFFR